MNPANIVRSSIPAFATLSIASFAMLSIAATPALAEWRWVEEAPTTRTETHVIEEHSAEPDYYQQEPHTYSQEPPVYYEEPRTHVYVHEAPVVTNREVFHDGRCQVTRTYLSDGTTTDDRQCTRLLWPHEFIIDSIGRHVDRWRYYHNIPY